MKKIFILFALLLSFFTLASSAQELYLVDANAKEQKRISEIGFKILNANQIPNRMVFVFDTGKAIKIKTDPSDRQIILYRGLYSILETDEEVASVLAHEISHGVDSYKGILRGYFYPVTYYLSARKYETKADKNAVDYLVKAGYNPLAYIAVLNKAISQKRFEVFSTRPITSRRLMNVYEYVYNKYPYFIANNSYKDNIYYQNFLLTSYQNRQKLKNKIETKSNRKINYL